MNSPDRVRDLAGCREAHLRVLATVAELTDEQARRPSLLPGWTAAHVVAHLARNADGFTNMMRGAARGEVWLQYEGGQASRNADIEAGALLPAADLVADLRTSVEALEREFDTADDATWTGRGMTVGGEISVADLPSRRWRETDVHHVDLGLGYRFQDWPALFVRLELVRLTAEWASRKPMGMTSLPPAALVASPSDRLAWLLGRLEIDGVAPAGITG